MQKKNVVLFETVFHQIMLLLAEKPRNEVVGLCFGFHKENKITLSSFVSMDNLDNSTTSFSLDYEVMYREIQRHEEKREILVGIFHSHPECVRLYPSQRDLYFMHYWPYPYLWLIGGIRGEQNESQLAIFTLLDEKIIEISYLITKDQIEIKD